jgi:hypothetical protein
MVEPIATGNIGSTLSFATLPMRGVNLLANLFGRDFNITRMSRDLLFTGNKVLDKQISIIGRAGGKDNDLYKGLINAKTQLNSFASSGNQTGIIGMSGGLTDILTKVQNIISPIPENFSYNPIEAGGRQDPNLKPFAAVKNPINRRLIPMLRIEQFLDKLEGKGKVFSKGIGRLDSRGKFTQRETLGQGFEGKVEMPRRRGSSLVGGVAFGKKFFSIDPLDLNAISERLAVPQPGDPDFVGPLQEQPSQPGKVDKGKIAKKVLKVASNFIRFPRQQRGGSASMGGFGNISELEQEEDRVIPSGFIRKQATTALAPTRRNALDTIV